MATPAPEAAVPPADVSEREALETEVGGLSSLLGRVDSSPTLAALLKVIARARVLGSEGFVVLKAFANRLRENRAFDDLYILTTEMRAAGMTDLDIRRWEIQALIEMGVFETALDLARTLIGAGPSTREGQDGYSALGRIYKQMYMDVAVGRSQAEPEVRALYLQRSYAAYMRVWQAEKSENTAYYGVNALAVLCRSVADGLAPDDGSTRTLADAVLSVVARPTVIWSSATQGEALISMGRYDEAAQAYATFATSPDVSLFQLNASLRQLEEVWRIEGADPARGAPVRLLKAVILSKLAGASDATGPGGAPRSAQVTISPREAQLIRLDFDTPAATPARGGAAGDPKGFERIFSVNAPVAIQVIRNAMTRARAICRIHANIGGRDTPFATGFAVEGRVLHEAWGADPVIVTNNHVISSRPGPGGQRADYCEAVFIDPETDEMRRVGFSSLLWESDQDAHDITILKPAATLPAHVLPLKQLPRAPLPPPAVDDEGIGRVYVIGFPAAGELSFSFADNVLLDHDAPGNCEIRQPDGGPREVKGVPAEPVRLHYRTPTLGGSSGSPVFDFNDFSLLGVHHRGLPDFRKLNGRPGAYAANEGIWIESIRAAISESEAEAGQTETSYLGEAGRRWRSLRVPPAISRTADATVSPQAVSGLAIGQGLAPPQARAPARVFPGAAGDMAAGYSPVAAQILKTGRASAAEIAAVSNESIIGLDDRTRIFETAMAPWRMICAIRCWWGSRLAVGTGAVVAPGLILTAGHVLIPRERRTIPDRIEVIPALNGQQRPYGDATVASISVHPRWLTSFNIADDVAAIHLARPLGHQLGWFATAVRPEDDLRSVWAHVTGYPGEKLDQMTDETGRQIPPVQAAQLWHHSAPILNVQNRRVFYAADTTPGQSGAPIYIVDPAVSPTPVIVGVHAYGKASTPVAVGQANSGAWIDPELFDLIASWRAESEAVLARGGAPA